MSVDWKIVEEKKINMSERREKWNESSARLSRPSKASGGTEERLLR